MMANWKSFVPRDYQITIANQATELLNKYKFAYLAVQVRVWKTFISLMTVKQYWAKKVLFLTKKKAISSIECDYQHFKDDFDTIVINYESLHKIEDNDFDLIVLDEAHKLWTYPKSNKIHKDVKKRFWKLPMILLSWTPSPESYSQFFHQFFTSVYSPWKDYRNFYKWAHEFVKIWIVYTSYWQSKDYSEANYDMIMKDIKHLMISYTQKEAWFTTEVEEKVLCVDMKPIIHKLVAQLKKNRVIESKWWEVLLADTAVKLQQKIHQLSSWTCKLESWKTIIIDTSKWDFIKEKFKWKKIWIFYNFKAEKELLKQVFWDNITDDLDEFNSTDKNIMLQIVSGREWISLKEADCLVFYNIAFSALSYFQAKDRLTTKERTKNVVYWIFSKWWMEEKIYESVKKKKNFTLSIFKKTYKIK